MSSSRKLNKHQGVAVLADDIKDALDDVPPAQQHVPFGDGQLGVGRDELLDHRASPTGAGAATRNGRGPWRTPTHRSLPRRGSSARSLPRTRDRTVATGRTPPAFGLRRPARSTRSTRIPPAPARQCFLATLSGAGGLHCRQRLTAPVRHPGRSADSATAYRQNKHSIGTPATAEAHSAVRSACHHPRDRGSRGTFAPDHLGEPIPVPFELGTVPAERGAAQQRARIVPAVVSLRVDQ